MRVIVMAERVEKLNLENSELQYHAVWSNECIEVWFILLTILQTITDRSMSSFLMINLESWGLGSTRKIGRIYLVF